VKPAAVFLVGLLLALSSGAQPEQIADRIFINAKIWTAEDGDPIAQALAVRGDRLLAVGPEAHVRTFAGPSTVVADLHGALVVPGFNDAHWHFSAREKADLSDAGSVGEIRRRLSEFAAARPGTSWIVGRGWGYADFPDRIPHRKYLDDLFPDRPVVIVERDGHMLLANSKALAIVGVNRETRAPLHGRIERDARGALTGELKESATALVMRHVPAPALDDTYNALKRTLDLAASYGLTSIQNASMGLSAVDMQAFRRALADDALKVRFYVAVNLERNADDAQLSSAAALRDEFKGPLLKFGSAKGMLDGTVDAKTAAMDRPYVGSTDTGIPMWTQEALDRTVARYDREGFQIMLHAIGDRAIHMALDAYEHAARENGTSGRRHRVEHAEVPRLDDFPRFKTLGVVASTQALFANPDRTTLENYAVLLGPERASHANAFSRFDAAGAVQAFGSDYEVFSMEALKGIYCAVTRMTPEGTPPGGWYPENRIPVQAALRHFTRDAAFASFDEQIKGTLEPGKLADFVVLSEDILTAPPDRILKTRILLTVMGGRDTYRAE
jgi:predicted amidohydrolase YtcJ